MAEQNLETLIYMVMMEKIAMVMELTLLVWQLAIQRELLVVLMFTGKHLVINVGSCDGWS